MEGVDTMVSIRTPVHRKVLAINMIGLVSIQAFQVKKLYSTHLCF